MQSDHIRIEERSLALHRAIAQRLRAHPELLQEARRNLERWMRRDGPIPPWAAWQALLDQPMAEIVALLESPGEVARELRQSSPFCGILTPQERWQIYESFTISHAGQNTRVL